MRRTPDTSNKGGFRIAAAFGLLLTLASVSMLRSMPIQSFPNKPDKICSSEILRVRLTEFIRQHSFRNSQHRVQLSSSRSDSKIETLTPVREVRAVYLVPMDKVEKEHYRTAISNSLLHLQAFYQSQMGAPYDFATFSLHDPIVEVYTTNHTTSFYTNLTVDPFAFFKAVISDGFALTGGTFNDPNYRWLYFVDAENACDQILGASSGVGLMATDDLRGLTREQGLICGASAFTPCRWVGGQGHELAHTWDIPHPPGCDQGNCLGGPVAASSLMWFGYSAFPNTYFLEEDKSRLFATGFLRSQTVIGPLFDCSTISTSVPPVILNLNQTDKAAALDSVLFVRDPFWIVNSSNLFTKPGDRNSRIAIFVKNIQLALRDSFNIVRIRITDSANNVYEVPAEDVRPLASVDFTQVVFRLPDAVSVGACTITVSINGFTSNSGTIQITN